MTGGNWTLYGSLRSPFVRVVRIAAAELGLDERLDFVPVATTPMTPAPELDGINPLGMVPTLVIGNGEVVFDSRVILDFLDAEAGGGRLFPAAAGPARRDCLLRQAMALGMMDKSVKLLDERFREQNRDTAEHSAGFMAAIRRTVAWFEPRLKAVSAAPADAGEIALFAGLSYLDMRFSFLLWRKDALGAAAWFEDFAARPSARATEYELQPRT